MKSQLEAMINKNMFYKDIPGLVIAIVQNGQTVYAKGFGVANIETKEPVTPKTIFHMASITKTLVGVSIMQLVEQKKVDLHKPVASYLPYFKLQDERYKNITILQMLNHTSGIPDCEDYEWENPEYDDEALERYVRGLHNLNLLWEPGERFRYSNIAYEILGDVIAKASGKSFEDYVKENILEPLAMHNSTLLLQNVKPEVLARPHVKNEHNEVTLSKVFPYNRKHGPSSTFYSNILDMITWAMVNLNRGKLGELSILKPSSYDLLWKGTISIPREEQEMGLSWFLSQHRGYKLVGHEGSDVGFRSSLGLMPEKNMGICVMANMHYASTRKIMKSAFDIMLGFEPQI